jgi:ATP-dependent helicase/nuclease subunit A
VQSPQLSFLFDDNQYQQAFNEVPIQYLEEDTLVYGIIDRLVLTRETVYVIDYKTHQWAAGDVLHRLADSYREQMRLYASGAQKLWPGRTIRPCLLFTACGELVAMDDPGSA